MRRKLGKLGKVAKKRPSGNIVSSFQTHQFIHICTTTLSCKTRQRANQISHISSLTSFYALKAYKEKSTSLSNDSHLAGSIDGIQPREECHIPYWFWCQPVSRRLFIYDYVETFIFLSCLTPMVSVSLVLSLRRGTEVFLSICLYVYQVKSFFFINFLEDTSSCWGATDAPGLDFWGRLSWVSQPGWIPRLHAFLTKKLRSPSRPLQCHGIMAAPHPHSYKPVPSGLPWTEGTPCSQCRYHLVLDTSKGAYSPLLVV